MSRKKTEDRKQFSWLFLITIAFIVMTWLIAIYLTLQSPNNESIFFDAVVALFTGVAFTGVIYSLHLQREDLQLNREELKLNREETNRQRQELQAQKVAMEQQTFSQHFHFMLTALNEKLNDLTLNYSTEEYLNDLKVIEREDFLILSESQFIEKFGPERLNTIKVFNDLLFYYDQHYQFDDKMTSTSLYLLTLTVTAQFSSLMRFVSKLALEHENFVYLQPQLKNAMMSATALAKKYNVIQF